MLIANLNQNMLILKCCIKFKTLKDINLEILETAILDGVKQTT